MLIENSYDAVIAGGGPAGLSAARAAAERGLRVLLVEQHAAIGVPMRQGGAMAIADMVGLGVPPHLYHPISRARVFGPSTHARFSFDEPIICVPDVAALDQHLAIRAGTAGAIIRPGTEMIEIVHDLDDTASVLGVQLRAPGGSIEFVSCRLVIDATGFPSTLALKGGVALTYRRAQVASQADLYAPHYPQDECALIVGGAIAPAGYAWVFPYGGTRVRVGVKGPTVKAADTALALLLDKHEPLRAAFKGAAPLEVRTTAIPVEDGAQPLVGAGTLATGDAAGQASPLAGRGGSFAPYAGRLAGQVAAQAIQQGDVSATALVAYDVAWRQGYGRNLRLAHAVDKALSAYSDGQWDHAIARLAALTPPQYARFLCSDLSRSLARRIVARRPHLGGALMSRD